MFQGSSQFFQTVDIIDQGTTIFAAGFGPIQTPDGNNIFGPLIIWSNTSGLTWQTVNLDPVIPSFYDYQTFYVDDEFTNGELMDLSIGTSRDIYAVGWVFTGLSSDKQLDVNPSALVYASHDGGNTFVQQKNPITVQNSLIPLNEPHNAITLSQLFGVDAYNASYVLAVGYVDIDNSESLTPAVIITTNGGTNWTAIEFKNKSLAGAIAIF